MTTSPASRSAEPAGRPRTAPIASADAPRRRSRTRSLTPAPVRTGSRSGAVMRKGAALRGPMELASEQERREAIAAARANGVEYVERDGRTFTLLHLPAELEPGRRRDVPAPVRSHSWTGRAVA